MLSLTLAPHNGQQRESHGQTAVDRLNLTARSISCLAADTLSRSMLRLVYRADRLGLGSCTCWKGASSSSRAITYTRPFSSSIKMASSIPQAAFPILKSVPEVRAWRKTAFENKLSVGFVPTMGALHEGHLELVRHSLANTDRTICSIFVNPAQFAPTEDLSSYPRTLESDLEKLQSLQVNGKKVEGLFLPSVKDLYPDGIEQDVSKQRGTFVNVVGFSQEMEGASRPTFFRGVATVVTKLFNIVQADMAYFGQKDIQQCLILRRMLSDLHFAHPPSPLHLKIVPTVRDHDQLALSSRNAYLSPTERQYAPLLYHALTAAESKIASELEKSGTVSEVDVLAAATQGMSNFIATVDAAEKAEIHLDYVKLNDPLTLKPVDEIRKGQAAVLSGAVKIGKTRLIDNLLINIEL